MDLVKLREIPGIAEFEVLCEHHSLKRLMKNEAEVFPAQRDEISIKLFGITGADTYFEWLPETYRPATEEEWETHFDFLYWEFDEEGTFWTAIGIDITNSSGDEMVCMDYLGRQMVCAIKGLHPNASLSFLSGKMTDDQIARAAEKWGEQFLKRS